MSWVQHGLADFARGQFEDGGSNLYVNADGVMEMIHRTSVSNHGYVDIILANSHGYIERGPTWIYQVGDGEGKEWPRRELPNDSGWMSRIVDVDGDGYLDLVVANGENGVTAELSSYIYWGGPGGLTGECTELATVGAYDVAITDINRDGLLDVIMPSAWVDHHNPGCPRPIQVWLQTAPRQFEDATQQYGLTGVGAVSLAVADLNGNGMPDLVVGNYRKEFQYDTDSFVYWGTQDGFDAANPLRLPTHYAMQVLLADLNGDGRDEIIFTGGDQVWIYWNDNGRFTVDRRSEITSKGASTMFCIGTVHAEAADVDGDGCNELILATENGVEIRHAPSFDEVETFLPLSNASWVHAADLDGDGRPDLIVSRYDDRISYDTESAVFWNSPAGFNAERVCRLPTAGARGCTAGDLDGDGTPEVVFNNTMRGPSQLWEEFPIYIYHGSENNDYGVDRRQELPVAGSANGYVLADLDCDGYADLAVVCPILQAVRLFHGGADGLQPQRFTDLPTFDGDLMQVHVADFNRDGYLDLLAGVQTYDDKPETMARSSVIFYGSADGFSKDRYEVVPTYCSGQMCVADVDKDGYIDIIAGDKRGYVAIYHGGPQGYSPERVTRIPLGLPLYGAINVADLNGNGWLDLIVAVLCHYERTPESFFILYGGPDGYDPANSQVYSGGYSPGVITVADYDKDGHLDLLVTGYSSPVTRVLPAKLFRGNGRTIDLDHPRNIVCNSSNHILPLDINRNGYPDLIFACHRDDLGHQVDSLIYWNGPEGISDERTTPLPGMGPHFMSIRDPGNAYTREPYETYVSAAHNIGERTPTRIHWEADVPETTSLKFQLRWAEDPEMLEAAPWYGAAGQNTYFEKPGAAVRGVHDAACWLQFRARFESLNGCRSPRLRELRIDLG
jgi:hypothetical protein